MNNFVLKFWNVIKLYKPRQTKRQGYIRYSLNSGKAKARELPDSARPAGVTQIKQSPAIAGL